MGTDITNKGRQAATDIKGHNNQAYYKLLLLQLKEIPFQWNVDPLMVIMSPLLVALLEDPDTLMRGLNRNL